MSSETFPIASNLSVSCSMAGNTQMTANQLQWFDEGTIILKAFNSEKVRQVIHYRPFPDDGYPRRCLLERNKAFLTGVLGLWGYESLDNLSIEQMVDKIFLHSITPFQPVLWHWSPTLVCSQDAQAIAEAIESESHYHFKTIPFAEIVRVSLGYETDAVKWFSHQHTLLSKTVTEHLRHHPEEVSLYEGVEKVLRTKSPFAHQALVQSLLCVRPESTHYDLPRPEASFDFISWPIKRLFLQGSQPLKILLDILDVLTIRFQRQYVGAHTMNWTLPFDTELVFLEDYYSSVTPRALALILTDKDLALCMPANMSTSQWNDIVAADHFRCIVHRIIDDDELRCRFIESWDKLSNSVWDCCVALPNIVPLLESCIEILIELRNYHSATSMMDGMNKYRISTGELDLTDECLNVAKSLSSAEQDDDQYPIVPWIQPILDERQSAGAFYALHHGYDHFREGNKHLSH